ncbi:MAG: tRNA (adenosine(37)-N6)-threonylcarbamoyltransferase complex ATPase subunit type 1 TsaE [Salibacteraceae bacterium]
METQVFEAAEVQDLSAAAVALQAAAANYRVMAFQGEMGMGKTTLIKVFCTLLGVQDEMSSPTFSIVNEYLSGDGKSIYHFDFYRLKNETEALDMGYEDYFYSGNLCLIEWPEKIASLLPPNHLLIKISENNRGREIHLIPPSLT